jgi:hypothetical protein
LDVLADNGEAFMNDMINMGHLDDEGDYTQAEPDPEPRQHGYDIGAKQLFPTVGMSTEEGMTATALATTLASCFPEGKRISQRTASYMSAEHKILCKAWLEISTDPICSTEQKGFNYWRKVGKLFHEQRNICEKPFQSDWNDLSLSKRWGTIHAECSKFQESFEKIQIRQISGLSSVDMVKPIPFCHCFWPMHDTIVPC